MRNKILMYCGLAMLALASLGPVYADQTVSTSGDRGRRPLQVSDLKELLPWIAANSVDKVTADGLLGNVELSVVTALEKNKATLKPLQEPSGDFTRDLTAFDGWLSAAVPDATTRGVVLREATLRALAQLKEDGTQFFPPNKYMLPPDVEGYDKGGAGVLVDQQPDPQGRFIIFETLDGFPGATVGLRSGDRLVAVGERSVIGLSYRELADLVRGNAGTKVTLHIERPGGGRQSFEIERVWLNPNPKNISFKVLPGGIGYVRVKYLGERMDVELLRVLDKFKADGVKKIVLDLRNNEGLLAGSQDVGGVFLGNNSEITKLVGRQSAEVRRTHGNKVNDMPMIVLINRYTSGAGVLLAGALRDHGRARLVGERTVWRDQPTETKELVDGSTVTVATGYYLLPNGKVLRQRDHSLRPDAAVVQDPLKPFGGADDAQLQRAVQMSQ